MSIRIERTGYEIAVIGLAGVCTNDVDIHLFVLLPVPSLFIGYHRAGMDPKSSSTIDFVKALISSKVINFRGIYSHSGNAYHAHSAKECEG